MKRESVVCDDCGWASKGLSQEKAFTRICPYCGMRSLRPW